MTTFAELKKMNKMNDEQLDQVAGGSFQESLMDGFELYGRGLLKDGQEVEQVMPLSDTRGTKPMPSKAMTHKGILLQIRIPRLSTSTGRESKSAVRSSGITSTRKTICKWKNAHEAATLASWAFSP